MKLREALGAVLAVLVLAGCTGMPKYDPGDQHDVPCTLTMTGPYAYDGGCQATGMRTFDGDGGSMVMLAATQSNDSVETWAAMKQPLKAGTFGPDDVANATTSILLEKGGTAGNDGTQSTPDDTLSLKLDSVKAAGANYFTVHGAYERVVDFYFADGGHAAEHITAHF